jgi:glucarate dehydratase
LTTEDGIVGYGECRGDALRYTSFQQMQDLLKGFDPYALERLRWIIAPQGLVELFQGSIASHVYSALEMACLDIIGKSTGKSVGDILGGRLRDEVDIAGYLYYTSKGSEIGEISSSESMIEFAKELTKQYGFKTLKYKCGVKTPNEEIETTRKLRLAFPDLKLRLDPNGGWGISTSVKFLSSIREYDIEYLEDPVAAFPKLSRIHAMNLGIPLASNQAVASLETIALNEFMKAVDIPLIDVNWYGGMRASITAARMAELIGLDVGIHSSMETAISQSAQLQVASCLPNMVHASVTHYIYLKVVIGRGGKIKIANGQMTVPTGPGLGREIDDEKLAHYHQLWESTGFISWSPESRSPVTLPKY